MVGYGVKNTLGEKEDMQDIDKIQDITDDVIEKASNVLEWFNQPKEEARGYLTDLIKKDTAITPQEKVALIYNSRKFTREYANSKRIYEQAKSHFNPHKKVDDIDNDWLHFFFDKAEKVSNEGMQVIWAKLLAGEFNKQGSISRKLIHIISIMDVHSARSFQTFCLYVFERYGLMTAYDTEAVLIPTVFYENSFDFRLKVEEWLKQDRYEDYRDLAGDITMNAGELNSLENLGLVQKVPDGKCGIPLMYTLENEEINYVVPQNDNEIPLGQYAFTQEGKQLYKILNKAGDKAVLKVIEQYLLSKDIKFTIQRNIL